MSENKGMLKVYADNTMADKEWKIYHNTFLDEWDITQLEYERISEKIISDSIDKTIKACKYYLYIRGY